MQIVNCDIKRGSTLFIPFHFKNAIFRKSDISLSKSIHTSKFAFFHHAHDANRAKMRNFTRLNESRLGPFQEPIQQPFLFAISN